MELQPGPFPVLEPFTAPGDPPDPGFAALVDAELGGLPTIEQDMDATLAPDAVFPDPAPDDAAQELLDYSEAVTTQIRNYDLEGEAARIEPYKQLVDESIVTAYEVIPAEGFQPVPAAFNPGDQPPPQIVANPMQLTLSNVDRPGATDFFVGERYQVDAHIPPLPEGGGIYAGIDVLIFPWVEDKPQDSINVGKTDQYGFLSAQGTWLIDQVGSWGATFYSRTPEGVLLAGPTLYWTVAVNPADPSQVAPADLPDVRTALNIGQVNAPPAVPTTITVKLENNTRPGDPNFRSTDHWTLTVGGLPNLDVTIWGTYQGDPLTPVVLGQTDDTGLFVLEGDMDPFYIGAWVERYKVGDEDWPGSLSFAVTE